MLALNNFHFSERLLTFFRILIIFNPLIFSFVVYFTDFVDFKQVFESWTYIDIAKNWLINDTIGMIPERLPLYPVFIYFVFKFFGTDNLTALLFIQGLLGSSTFYFLLKTLDLIKLSRNLFLLLSIFFNLSVIFWFTVFLPNSFFIFLITLFIFFFTKFFIKKSKNYFFLMCFFLILLLLTRPIFTLSIVLVLPLISLVIIKCEFNYSIKILMIIALFSSYFIGISIQSLRYYSYNKSFNYTTQTGHHLLYFVIPCLAQKYGCGQVNPEVYKFLASEYEKYRKKNPDLSINEENKIKINLSINYLINNLNFFQIVLSSTSSYLKTLFHSSVIQIYQSFEIMPKKIQNIYFSNPSERIVFLTKNFFEDLKIAFWLIAIIFVFLKRLVQFFGILLIFSKNPYRLYILTIFTTLLTLIIPTVGIGNPRYRSESEVLLIILGAFGFYAITEALKKKKKNL